MSDVPVKQPVDQNKTLGDQLFKEAFAQFGDQAATGEKLLAAAMDKLAPPGKPAPNQDLLDAQKFARDQLLNDKNLKRSLTEKKLMGQVQDSLIGGDIPSFDKAVHDLSAHVARTTGPLTAIEGVRQDFDVIEQNLRKCGVALNLNVTADGRILVYQDKSTVAVEYGNQGPVPERLEHTADGSVAIDQSKEVLKPTPDGIMRAVSEDAVAKLKKKAHP